MALCFFLSITILMHASSSTEYDALVTCLAATNVSTVAAAIYVGMHVVPCCRRIDAGSQSAYCATPINFLSLLQLAYIMEL